MTRESKVSNSVAEASKKKVESVLDWSDEEQEEKSNKKKFKFTFDEPTKLPEDHGILLDKIKTAFKDTNYDPVQEEIVAKLQKKFANSTLKSWNWTEEGDVYD